MKSKILGLTALAVILVGSVATLGWARGQADETIRACVAKNGDVRILDSGGACKKGETATQWSVTGPQGATGPQGPAGPQGPTGASGSAQASPDAVEGSFTITGSRQGPFAGGGSGGTMILIGLSQAIVSPRDAASGLPTGKRQHKPFTIIKELDKASPLILRALITNETLTSAVFSLTKGGSSSPYMTVKLTNASVASRTQTGTRETIEFTYQKIEWTWVDGGITAEDDWSAPAA